MKKIYLAGSYTRKDELLAHAERLRGLGYGITSRWLNAYVEPRLKAEIEGARDTMPLSARQFAKDDYWDLHRADVLMAFSEPPHSGSPRGGRHVEFGLAMAWNKTVIVVGPRGKHIPHAGVRDQRGRLPRCTDDPDDPVGVVAGRDGQTMSDEQLP